MGWLGSLLDVMSQGLKQFPSREERIRNEIGKLRSERDELEKKEDLSDKQYNRLMLVINRLSNLEKKLQNR